MTTEESPLFDEALVAGDSPGRVFTSTQKKYILFVVSVAGLLPMIVSATFVPTIPQVSKDLQSTDAAVSLAVSLSVFATAIGPLCWASYSSVALLGPALAPLAGGTAAKYSSWRHIHVALATWGILQYLLVYFTLPETSHSHQKDRSHSPPHERPRLVWINPFRCLVSLRSPNLFAINLHGSFALLTDFVLLVPIAHTIGAKYHITNEALIGACILPNGVGNFIGALLAGRVSDITVGQWRQKRQGVWVPEDRLRKTWIGALVLCPLAILASGLLTTFVDGPIGLGLNLLCLFSNGAGVDFVLNPVISYSVDLSQSQSAELMAAGNALRSFVVALGSAAVVPSIQHIGVAWTNGIAALLVWSTYGWVASSQIH
ncbi:MFS general substrate transporter [Paxillus ammoniavirescens]|nr:MFS general substrate transporter [Paxillus ammoniavirescens]